MTKVYIGGDFIRSKEDYEGVLNEIPLKDSNEVVIIPKNTKELLERNGRTILNCQPKNRYENIESIAEMIHTMSGGKAKVSIESKPLMDNKCEDSFYDYVLENWNNGKEFDSSVYVVPDIEDRIRSLDMLEYGRYFSPKKVFIRCNDFQEFLVFLKVFGNEYFWASPIFLDVEIRRLGDYIRGKKVEKNYITCDKMYTLDFEFAEIQNLSNAVFPKFQVNPNKLNPTNNILVTCCDDNRIEEIPGVLEVHPLFPLLLKQNVVNLYEIFNLDDSVIWSEELCMAVSKDIPEKIEKVKNALKKYRNPLYGVD